MIGLLSRPVDSFDALVLWLAIGGLGSLLFFVAACFEDLVPLRWADRLLGGDPYASSLAAPDQTEDGPDSGLPTAVRSDRPAPGLDLHTSSPGPHRTGGDPGPAATFSAAAPTRREHGR